MINELPNHLFMNLQSYNMRHVMRNPVFGICKNKGTDQLLGAKTKVQISSVAAQLVCAFVLAP